MATTQDPSVVGRLSGILRLLELERAFFIFGAIYIPVAWLFYNQGPVEKALLAVYSLIMIVMAFILIAKFCVYLAIQASEPVGHMGGVFLRYIVDGAVPLAGLKIFAHVLFVLLPPDRHLGLVCDLVRLLRQLYGPVLHVQASLNLIFVGSSALVFAFTLWGVARHSSGNK